ncbi:phosphate/phosphite/phosphonate ABC transporter substrate-binding protein [Lyngbya confervoides]|uniref:Phosphate/phosphite/phosphonate ABC transporter substrate-binding protein n=1 Tax=Lyngbya confervoides BDU141951 TaxID=1574623 RepID=A0ABD4T298_9CYAN|nr:PhnD/SsuA/transferrin family substrate-binding protein [Lyngbya confervoides]MCM1982702.1 phosphate/phosphite/phosphonate ABC transporter substrate-binding protein [Lyngbya confervoides BDU141951]
MIRRRFLVLGALALVSTACGNQAKSPSQLVVGVLSYGEGATSLEKHDGLKAHLAQSLKSIVQLEPALNEVQAIQQISQKSWDVVIAPPGLAAIAISQAQYSPVMPRVGANQEQRSILVVRQESPAKTLDNLGNQVVALGQEGSATGYYFPIYNLYGLTLSQVKFAATPKQVLEWVDKGEAEAGALSLQEFDLYKQEFDRDRFRILFRDSHPVPAGSILVSPNLSEETRQLLVKSLEKSPLQVLEDVGFAPNAAPPNYDYLIRVVKRVRPIAQRIRQQPAPLY